MRVSKYNQSIDRWAQLVMYRMGLYLRDHAADGKVKERLKDQLTWLKYQVVYYHKSHDIKLLESNFNWVISNFNRDLRLKSSDLFEYMKTSY